MTQVCRCPTFEERFPGQRGAAIAWRARRGHCQQQPRHVTWSETDLGYQEPAHLTVNWRPDTSEQRGRCGVHRQLSTAPGVQTLQLRGQECPSKLAFQTPSRVPAGEALLTSRGTEESSWKRVCRAIQRLNRKSQLSMAWYSAHRVSTGLPGITDTSAHLSLTAFGFS